MLVPCSDWEADVCQVPGLCVGSPEAAECMMRKGGPFVCVCRMSTHFHVFSYSIFRFLHLNGKLDRGIAYSVSNSFPDPFNSFVASAHSLSCFYDSMNMICLLTYFPHSSRGAQVQQPFFSLLFSGSAFRSMPHKGLPLASRALIPFRSLCHVSLGTVFKVIKGRPAVKGLL